MSEYHIDRIKMFLECPAKYDFFFNWNIPEDKKFTKNEISKMVLKELFDYYFERLHEGKKTELRQLKAKWLKVDDKYRRIVQKEETVRKLYGVREQKDQFLTKEKEKELETLYKFFSFIAKQNIVPIAVNQPYKYQIDRGGDNSPTFITGSFDLLQEFKIPKTDDANIEAIQFRASSRQALPFYVQTDLELSSISYAFEELFDKKADRLGYLELNQNKYTYTKRNNKDYDRMVEQINYAIDGIENEKFIPIESSKCLSCPFQELCLKRYDDDE